MILSKSLNLFSMFLLFTLYTTDRIFHKKYNGKKSLFNLVLNMIFFHFTIGIDKYRLIRKNLFFYYYYYCVTYFIK